MDVSPYLQRINYDGLLQPTAQTLRLLHVAHMRAVPFENLDIPLGRPLVLEEKALFDKIVNRRRGGFCYELNGLFSWLLQRLGFKVTILSASVLKENGQFGPLYDHMVLWVQTADSFSDSQVDWLVDVGFGNSFQHPLRLEDSKEQVQPSGTYRLVPYNTENTLMQQQEEGHWQDKFIFARSRRQLSDFVTMCHYHQTSPTSMFTQRRLCTRATPEGRITLSDNRLLITTGNLRLEHEIVSQTDYKAILWQYFQIEI